MRKLANIQGFESLQNHANNSMNTQSEMVVFNFDDNIGGSAEEDDIEWDDEDEDDDESFGERLPKSDAKEQKELEDRFDCHSYLDMLNKSECVLANFMGDRIREKFGDGVELISGNLGVNDEVYQWFIVGDPWFIQYHTYEPLFYDEEYDVYVLGVRNLGTHRSMVPAPQLR